MVNMSLISGIRLHTALSIMLVSTLIFAQFASTSVLEQSDDAAPSGENDDTRENDATQRIGMDFAAGGDAVSANGVSTEHLFDLSFSLDSDECGEALDANPLARHPADLHKEKAEGRQASDANQDSDAAGDENTDSATGDHAGDGDTGDHAENDGAGDSAGGHWVSDWNLPEGVEVWLTAAGEYVVVVRTADGVIREEVMTLHELEEFLLNHYPDFYAESESETDYYDEWDEDLWWEPVPVVHLEFLENGNILVIHELDGEIWWDYINFAEDGSITVIRIDAWGTEVTHPAPMPMPNGHGDHPDRDRGDNDDIDHDWYVERGNGPRMDSAAGLPFDNPCGGDDAPAPVEMDWIAIDHDAAPRHTDA